MRLYILSLFSKISVLIIFLVLLGVRSATAQFDFIKIVDTKTARPDGAGNFLFHQNTVDPSTDGSKVIFRTLGNNGRSESIWVASVLGGALTKILDRNSAVPGGVGNFTDFGMDIGAPLIDQDQIAFPGLDSTLPVGKPGIYSVSANGGTISRIADLNTPVPRGSGNFEFVSLTSNNFGNIAISNGKILFSGLGSASQRGIYETNLDGSNLDVVAHEKNPMHPTSPFPVNGFFYPALNGNFAVFTGSTIFGFFGLYSTTHPLPALSLNQEPPYTELLTANTVLPEATGTPGNTLVLPNIILDGDTVVFTGEDRATEMYGIYTIARAGGPIIKIADSNDLLPGLGTLNANASFHSSAASNGSIAFFAQDNTGKQGIYLFKNGAIVNVLKTGDILNGRIVSTLGELSTGALRNGFLAITVTFNFVEGQPNAAIFIAAPACTIDSDLDGAPDCSDLCSSDPAKIVPGVCGCSTPDVDANGNGTIDCLVEEEFRDILDELLDTLKSVKLTKTGVASRQSKAAKAEVQALLAQLVGIVGANVGQIPTTSANIDLNKLVRSSSKAVKKSLRFGKDFAANKRKAIKAINKLSKAVGT